MLIVIEGLDGAGKSTQVKMLKEFILKSGYSLEYLHFPRYEAPVYGDLIASFLRGDFGDLNQVHPQLVALLYALDRKDAAEEIRRKMESGAVVLLDRYVYSNIAYQCSKVEDEKKREELRDWILNLEFEFYKIPKPDVNIFLDVPIDFVAQRLASSRSEDSGRDYLEGKRDIHEEKISFQEGVRNVYLSECKRDASFKRVDCRGADGKMLSPDEIFELIKREINYLK